MNKYLSLIFLYNRASHRKLLLLGAAIPLCFGAIFLLRIGNPYEASSYMLMERGFGGMWAVVLLIAVNLMGLLAVANSINGRKAMKATHATTGYTIRRLGLSPTSAYLIVFVYYLAVIIIFMAVAIASLYVIGKMGLTMAGATGVDTKLALGLLRTDIGHALIPISHPPVIIFNIVAVLALAGECARSCYFGWHNGTPSAGVVLVVALMLYVWAFAPENSYILMSIIVIVLYGGVSFGDVIYREKRPKGDPFRVNKYVGVMDMDSTEFDDNVFLEVNTPGSTYGQSPLDVSLLQRYGRVPEKSRRKWLRKLDLLQLRRRFLPLGISLEKANGFFGACIFIGFGEHLLFYGKYLMQLSSIRESINGITIDSAAKMPYFWDLQEHSYYGYLIGILLVLIIQMYWNYAYYNKETKSVYVMKRLPNRKEYPRTIWVAPVIESFFVALIMVLHTLFDLCMYALVTPEIALQADYLSHILPF